MSKSTHAIHWSWCKGKQKHIWENDSEDNSSHDDSDNEGGGNRVDLYDDEDEFDINVNMEIEATLYDFEAVTICSQH